MCVSFTIVGSMLSSEVAWDRLGAIALIYTLALGISAHVADGLGSKRTKPWGSYFSKMQLVTIMAASLIAAYTIGLYYIVFFAPLLAIIAILEGFFLFTYNYEMWGGIFHNDFWFAVSWGSLPVLAGYVIQSNSISILAVMTAILTGFVAYVEIRMSRPYKNLKKSNNNSALTRRLETSLKVISVSTITFALSMLAFRIMFS
jgi:hypothetical protein